MRTAKEERGSELGDTRQIFLVYLAISMSLSLAAMLAFNWAFRHGSVFTLSNFVGPTARTLLHGEGLTVCSVGLGTIGNPICFHAARMPVPSAAIALGAALVGDRFLWVGLFKLLLLLAPLEAAALLAIRALPLAGWRRMTGLTLLLLPFVMTAFLADVVNLQVEEGYSYSLLALATALVLFRPAARVSWRRVLVFAASAAGLYLAKSSMAPAVLVLTLAFLWPMRRWVWLADSQVAEARRAAPGMTAVTVGVVLLAAGGWAGWQHHAAGRYTFGTSIDGVNLHKGNNALFLARYPPGSGETLDMYDPALNRGHTFADEWSFNDYHQRAAVQFIRTHPRETGVGAWRKLKVLLFSLEKLGSKPRTGLMEVAETGGLVLFRLLFWAALLLSLRALLRGGGERGGRRSAAAVFLLIVGAVALPYVVGFAYTRHVSVLIYPSALLLCRMLAEPEGSQGMRQGLH